MSLADVQCSCSVLRSTSTVRIFFSSNVGSLLLRLHQDSVVGVNSVGYLQNREIVRNGISFTAVSLRTGLCLTYVLVFLTVREGYYCFRLFVRRPVCMEKLGSHWTSFLDI